MVSAGHTQKRSRLKHANVILGFLNSPVKHFFGKTCRIDRKLSLVCACVVLASPEWHKGT